ncbi:hypothetical protein [Methanosarcina sp. UBA411]|jgi:hypothetical protein|uniref:hypothetical protein n=1 Tax=Methanosarcina sp. UBA411 TaxID=1915589 RepID=UPI0025F39763|nr:hypothetical protein [Methanosarcina sp. UBA411]
MAFGLTPLFTSVHLNCTCNAFTSGNLTTCPVGGEMIPCNKDNMRFEFRDGNGKVFYEEGKDTF